LITPYDVPSSKLVQKLAKYLKENIDTIIPPAWTNVAKTGSHVKKEPQDPEWWYTRCASILRKVCVKGSIGTEKLRAEFGGTKRKGGTPAHVTKAGGSPIRKSLQQLEAAGLIEKAKPSGRTITKKGRKLLQELAEELGKELAKESPT